MACDQADPMRALKRLLTLHREFTRIFCHLHCQIASAGSRTLVWKQALASSLWSTTLEQLLALFNYESTL